MNQAMLAKESWRIHQGDPGLWASIYRRKYLGNGTITDRNYHAPRDCSSTWRSIVYGANLLKQGLIWRVGDGRTINFWTDIWLPPAPLIEFATPSTVINTANKVFRFWDFNGWNLALLSSCLPDDIVGKIISVPPCLKFVD